MESAYAAEAVQWAEGRAKQENDRRAAEANRLKQIDQTLQAIKEQAAERKRQDEARQRQLQATRFEASLRDQFLHGNPGATESDWQRNRQQILDEAMRERARREPLADLVARKRRSGMYGNVA
jgi:UDP-N-acetylglucosamine pyrophosphorylase